MKFPTKLIVLLVNIQFFLLPSFSQVDALDSSFGQDGIVKSFFYGGGSFVQKPIVQPDGKTLIAGYLNEDIDEKSSKDFFIIRLNNDGSIDCTFGLDGEVSADFSIDTPDVMDDFAWEMVL